MIKTIHPEAFMWASELQLQNIARTCAGLDLRTQEPLSRHTSFRTGGPAALMAFPRTPEELQLLLRSAAAEGVTPYLLGAGTHPLPGQMDSRITKGPRSWNCAGKGDGLHNTQG